MSYKLYVFIAAIMMASIHLATSSKSKPVKFPKDQRIDITFPAKVTLPHSAGLPIGHLRPLGHQRRSSGEVTTSDDIIEWNTEKPLQFKELIDAHSIWPQPGKDEDKNSMTVLVTKRSTNGVSRYENMNLTEFFENYGSEEWLLDYILPQELIDNIGKIPEAFSCLSEKLLYVSSSLTSGITSDDIKVSPYHKLQCVLRGRRDYIIMKKSSTTPILSSTNPQIFCGMETIVNLNPDLVNVFDNPWIISVTWQHATLKTGDCILLPADSLVHSTSYGPACETITFHWHSKINNGSCKKSKPAVNKLAPLMCSSSSDQKPKLCNYSNLEKEERWRELLLNFLNKDGVLTKSCLSNLVKNKGNGDEVFKMFGTVPVTEEVILELSKSTLTKMLNAAASSKHQHIHDEL